MLHHHFTKDNYQLQIYFVEVQQTSFILDLLCNINGKGTSCNMDKFARGLVKCMIVSDPIQVKCI